MTESDKSEQRYVPFYSSHHNEGKSNLSSLWYWYSLDLEIIFLIFYWTSPFINTLWHESVIEWLHAIALNVWHYVTGATPHSVGIFLPFWAAFLAPLRKFSSSPKMKSLLLDTDNHNCRENVGKTPTLRFSLSKTADLYVLKNYLLILLKLLILLYLKSKFTYFILLKKWALTSLHQSLGTE